MVNEFADLQHDVVQYPTLAPEESPEEHQQSHPTKTEGIRQPFPQKLMEMVTNETVECSSIVSWLPDGHAFMIRKPMAFTSEIIPKVSTVALVLPVTVTPP